MDSEPKAASEEFTETDPLKSPPKGDKKITFCQQCKYVLDNVTVEPSMFLFIMAAMISMITTQNLSLEKACRVNLNYSKEICHSLRMQELESQNEYEKNAQKILAHSIASRTYITATIPCLLALFSGSWADKTGHRKIFMVVCLMGQLAVCFNNMLNVYFFEQLPLEVLIYSEALLESFTGGWCIYILTAFSFISAITTNETRTFRMGLINFSLTAGFPIGMGVSGLLVKKGGYYAGYGLAATLHTINLLYNSCVLKDPVRSKEQKKHDGRGFIYFIKSFFDASHIKDTLKMVFKKTPDNRRFRLLIFLVVVCILFGPMYGEVSIMYMSTRYRFNWDEMDFSIFQTYNFILHTFGTIFSIFVFSKFLKWDDSVLGMISSVSKIASSFVYCFAATAMVFYFAPLVDILGGTGILALRSIFSKTVDPDELGKMNSLIGLTENLMPLLYVPLYTQVYTATMEVLPGAVFLMGTGMTIPALAVFIWLFVRHRKSLKTKKEEEAATPMT